MNRIDGSPPDGATAEYAYKAQAALAFIRHWDGTQPELFPEDTEAAAAEFDQLIEIKHTEYADYTQGTLMTYLRLDHWFGDGSGVTMNITTSSTMAEAGGHRGTLRLIEVDPSGTLRETYDYTLSPDKLTVHRTDVGVEEEKRAAGIPPRVSGNPSTGWLSPDLRDAYENTTLEDEIGLNNQPVGLSEMQRVVELVEFAVPVRVN